MSTPIRGTPSAEHPIDRALVRALIAEQHPDLSDQPLVDLDAGWDNVLFRLGEDRCVRLPRRRAAVPLLEHEQAWLPRLADALPLPVPAPLRIGRPCSRYPWPWSICPWLPGTPADQAPPGPDQARPLAEFLVALHQPALAGAPQNPYRGVPLAQRADGVEARLRSLAARRDHFSAQTEANVRRIWHEALAAPIDQDPTWVHGDLHARNVLTHQGSITAILDWGDLCVGDRATDLAAIWMLLPTPRSRAEAIDAVTRATGATAHTWRRARGWCVLFGVALLDTGLVDHPRHATMGALALARAIEQ